MKRPPQDHSRGGRGGKQTGARAGRRGRGEPPERTAKPWQPQPHQEPGAAEGIGIVRPSRKGARKATNRRIRSSRGANTHTLSQQLKRFSSMRDPQGPRHDTGGIETHDAGAGGEGKAPSSTLGEEKSRARRHHSEAAPSPAREGAGSLETGEPPSCSGAPTPGHPAGAGAPIRGESTSSRGTAWLRPVGGPRSQCQSYGALPYLENTQGCDWRGGLPSCFSSGGGL